MRRILSIDGGGIKGVFPASFLANIEQQFDHPIGSYFDLIAGTSTGGIIALGLGLGFSAREILEFYEKYGPQIFRGHKNPLNSIRQIVSGKYKSEPLKKALEETFGERRLGDSARRLMIPALNLQNGEPHVYKTAHNERLRNDYRELVVDVALATSAAPTYFPFHRSAVQVDLIDGGVYANNPTGMAVAEAIGTLRWPQEELVVLSLACTSTVFDRRRSDKLQGAVYWAKPALDLFMRGQSHASLGIAFVLLDHQRVVRISPTVDMRMSALDDTSHIRELKSLGYSEARKYLPQLDDMFFSSEAEPFDPIYKL